MKTSDNTHRSRVLAYTLRHDKNSPIEREGWLSIEYLTSKKDFSYDEIRNIVENDEKCRFELSTNQTKVRALYGHSVPVDLQMDCTIPPCQTISWHLHESLNRHF